MHKALLRKAAALCFLALVTAGCSGPGRLVQLPAGQAEIGLTAKSFSFDPEQIVAPANGTLTLRVRNVSESNHNFTVTDPDGAILRSVELPAGETVPVEVSLGRPGVYRFYCATAFHPTLGMEGRIEAR